MVRLAVVTIAGGLRRRLRRWFRHVRTFRQPRLTAWRESTGTSTGIVHSAVDLVVATSADLRRWVEGVDHSRPVRRLRVVVEDWRSPSPGWSGRLGPVPHLVAHGLALPATGRGRAEVSVDLDQPVAVSLVVAAVLDALAPNRPLPAVTGPEVVVYGRLPAWLPPSSADSPPTRRSAPTRLRRHDVMLSAAPVGAAPDESTTAGSPDEAARLSGGPYGLAAGVVLVDAVTANPAGRRRYDGRLPAGVLHLTEMNGEVRWWVARGRADGVALVAGRVGDNLDPRQRAVLNELSLVTTADLGEAPARAAATSLVQLAMTGVPLHVSELPPRVADHLAGELAALLVRAIPSDPIDREVASVRLRRAAMRHHAAGLALPHALNSLSRPPSVTALLLTRRPDRLPQVLADLSRQTYPELEVVVGLHGVTPTPAAREAVDRYPGPIEIVSVPAAHTFGGALGEATRWARGSLLTKVDDDDRYGPEHVWDLVLARHYSGATVVGKGAEFVYIASRDETVRRSMESETFDGYVAGGTILLGRGDLEAVGGWRPVARSVDRALLERVLGAGGIVYRTHGFGYLYTRHDGGHTWEVSLDRFDGDAVRRWQGQPPYEEFAA